MEPTPQAGVDGSNLFDLYHDSDDIIKALCRYVYVQQCILNKGLISCFFVSLQLFILCCHLRVLYCCLHATAQFQRGPFHPFHRHRRGESSRPSARMSTRGHLFS